MTSPDVSRQFDLMRQRRFAPFFWTQFLGAANDNVFKFAFTVLVTYRLQVDWLPTSLAGLVIAAVFILPFLLFSATAGQVADKFDKARIARGVKTFEIGIMGLVALGLWVSSPALLLGCIFLMGLHSTVFGPVKYAYLPQHLSEREITGGNGLVEMGTFVAILLGNLLGGVLIALPDEGVISGMQAVAGVSLGLAVLGRWASARIPDTPALAPDLKINWNPFTETWRNLQLSRTDRTVFRSLLGISWMWFFGAVFLSQFPSFAKDVLHGDEHVASLLLVVFSVGVGVGALLCETLSRQRVEVGLVPVGAFGMSLFAADLWLACSSLPTSGLQDVRTFLGHGLHWRVLFDLLMLSLSAGIYSVPMYALIQVRSPESHRARIVAANNILNAVFMIASSLIVGAMLGAGVSIPEVFGWLALGNAAVVMVLCLAVPEFVERLGAWSKRA